MHIFVDNIFTSCMTDNFTLNNSGYDPTSLGKQVFFYKAIDILSMNRSIKVLMSWNGKGNASLSTNTFCDFSFSLVSDKITLVIMFSLWLWIKYLYLTHNNKLLIIKSIIQYSSLRVFITIWRFSHELLLLMMNEWMFILSLFTQTCVNAQGRSYLKA